MTTTETTDNAHHPALVAHQQSRAASAELRVADAITSFAGSMKFVYLHAVIFAVWCGTGLFGADKFPFNFLTMAVSLEAIFLSTFVMTVRTDNPISPSARPTMISPSRSRSSS